MELQDKFYGIKNIFSRCGLVAATIASHVLTPEITVEELLKEARNMKISNHGEMFNAQQFAQLINKKMDVKAVVVQDLLESPKHLVTCLFQKKFILVP